MIRSSPLLQDLRFAFRTLGRSPGFAAAALSILAVGIGIQTAAFSLLDAVVLSPLPAVRRSSDLVDLRAGGLSYPAFVDIREQAGVFDAMGAWGMRSFDLSASRTARRLRGGVVSGDYFQALGVRPQRGRLLAPADEQSGAPIAVLSDGLWHSAFGASPSIVGSVLKLNGVPFTVVGVADRGLRGVAFGQPADLWIPIGSFRQTATGALARLDYRRRGWGWLSAFGRLKPGVSISRAQSALDPLVRRLAVSDPDGALEAKPIPLEPLLRTAAGSSTQVSPARLLALLCGAVGLVLLVACANLANLLLGRAISRRPEIAVRLALGAGRLRIGRQLLTESLLLAVLGGVGGLFVAQWTLALAIGTPLPGGESLEIFAPGLDLRAFLVAVAVTLFTAVAFGLAPAVQAARTEVISALKQRSFAGPRRGRLYGILVASQVALCLVLLATAGLFLRSLQRALSTDPGFQPRGVATASVELGLARYDAARANRFAEDLAARVGALPGVRSTAWAGLLPLSGDRNRETFKTDREPNRIELAEFAAVGPGYFRTLRHPIVRGREFQASTERPADDVRAVIVNEAAARLFWPGENAVGRRVHYGETDATVVGVCADSLFLSLTQAHLPMLYVPMNQLGGDAVVSAMTLLARTDGDPASLAAPIAAQVARLDPTLPVFGPRTLSDITASQLLAQKVGGTMLGVFAVLSLVLSAVGIYSVVAAAAARRTRELALRLALGARPEDLRRRVLLEGAVPVGAGLAAGLALAAVAGRLASRFLFGVTASDLPTFLAAVLVLAASALFASDLPARRVMRVDPMQALRTE